MASGRKKRTIKVTERHIIDRRGSAGILRVYDVTDIDREAGLLRLFRNNGVMACEQLTADQAASDRVLCEESLMDCPVTVDTPDFNRWSRRSREPAKIIIPRPRLRQRVTEPRLGGKQRIMDRAEGGRGPREASSAPALKESSDSGLKETTSPMELETEMEDEVEEGNEEEEAEEEEETQRIHGEKGGLRWIPAQSVAEDDISTNSRLHPNALPGNELTPLRKFPTGRHNAKAPRETSPQVRTGSHYPCACW